MSKATFLALIQEGAKEKNTLKFPFNLQIQGGKETDGVTPQEVEEMIARALADYYKKTETDDKYQTKTQADYEFWVLKDEIDLKENITAHNTDMQSINSQIQSLDTEMIDTKSKVEDHETRIHDLEQVDYDNGTLPLLEVFDNQGRKLYGLNQGGGESQANGAYTFNTTASSGSEWGDSAGVWRNKKTNQVVKFNLNHYSDTGGTTVHMVTHNGSYHMAEFDVGVWDGTYQWSNITCTVTTNPTNNRIQFVFSQKTQLINNMIFERI